MWEPQNIPKMTILSIESPELYVKLARCVAPLACANCMKDG